MEIGDILKEIYSSMYNLISVILQPFYDIVKQYYLDNPMFKIILAFVPVLLSMAYPLIIQTIGRLNDHYNSGYIISRFKKERYHILFLWNLRVSVALTLLCFVLSLEIFFIAFISVVSLIIVFFLYLNQLLSYQNGKDLFEFYISRLSLDFDRKKKYKPRTIKRIKKEIMASWYPIVDILLFAINRRNRPLENDVLDLYIYKSINFIKYLEQEKEETITFPSEFYNSSYDIINTYLTSGEKDYYQNIETFVGPIFFTESFDRKKPKYIHQDTLNSTWRNLVLLIEHNRSDKVLRYWERAHQYCRFYLELPEPSYDENFVELTDSIKLRGEVLKNRNAFIQFHTVLGAYLKYKNDLVTIKRIWFFTQSQPADYILVPNNPNEIINQFFTFLSDEFHNPDIAIRYWFKDLSFSEMNNRPDVKQVVREYLVLLLLRLYIADGYYGNHPMVDYPQIPQNQPDKVHYQEGLVIFKKILENLLSDNDLLTLLGLDIITEKWCTENRLPYPIDYINEYGRRIENDFKKTITTSVLDDQKITELDNYTVNSIKASYGDIVRLNGSDIQKENRDKISDTMEVIRGIRILLTREAFIRDPSVHYINSDKIMGEMLQNAYYKHFATKVALQKRTNTFVVPFGQQFKAIDILNPDPVDYFIIAFGLNMEYIRNIKNVEIDNPTGNENYRYNSIPIYSFDYTYTQVDRTIFLIKNEYKPMIKHQDWRTIEDLPKKTKERWEKLELLDQDLSIYKKITELNQDETLRAEYLKQGKTEEDLKNMLEYDVDFLGYCWFNKNTQTIAIKESIIFKEGGSTNDLDKIRPLK